MIGAAHQQAALASVASVKGVTILKESATAKCAIDKKDVVHLGLSAPSVLYSGMIGATDFTGLTGLSLGLVVMCNKCGTKVGIHHACASAFISDPSALSEIVSKACGCG